SVFCHHLYIELTLTLVGEEIRCRMKMIEVKSLKKSFGKLEVLKDINIDVAPQEVVCVIGPSGSGKSTPLRCMNRLEEPTAGEIFIEEDNLTDTKTNINQLRPRMGMVLQQFNLFPHKTVMEKITMGPQRLKGKSKTE